MPPNAALSALSKRRAVPAADSSPRMNQPRLADGFARKDCTSATRPAEVQVWRPVVVVRSDALADAKSPPALCQRRPPPAPSALE